MSRSPRKTDPKFTTLERTNLIIDKQPTRRPRWRTALYAVVAIALWAWIFYSDQQDPVIHAVATFASRASTSLIGYPSSPTSAPAPQAPTLPEEPTFPPHAQVPPPLHAKEVDYKRLTASDATPAMLAQAYELVQECKRNASLLSTGRQPLADSDTCKLAPGEPDMAALRRMLAARVARNDYGAWIDVMTERTGAFADDRPGWSALVKQAWQSGLANGEPTVLGAESQSLIAKGDALRAEGQAAEAQAAYREAAAYAVARAIGVARLTDAARMQYAIQPLGTVDVSADEGVRAAFAKLASADERTQAIEAGKVLAQKWKAAS